MIDITREDLRVAIEKTIEECDRPESITTDIVDALIRNCGESSSDASRPTRLMAVLGKIGEALGSGEHDYSKELADAIAENSILTAVTIIIYNTMEGYVREDKSIPVSQCENIAMLVKGAMLSRSTE